MPDFRQNLAGGIMGCQVHQEAQNWLTENGKHRDKWIKRYENIGAGSFLLRNPLFSTVAAVNFLLARSGGNLVEKAINACIAESDCKKAENWFRLAKSIATLV